MEQNINYPGSAGPNQVSSFKKNLEVRHWKTVKTLLLFSFPIYYYFFNRSIVDLQCWISFRCTAKWFSHTHTYMCVCVCVCVCVHAHAHTQSCPTLCDPMDCRQPGSTVHGISQARILVWISISFSRGSSLPWDRTRVSYISCTGMWILYC